MNEVRPTLDTVAKAAGVSRMTVSNAYSRPDQLSAATRARVLAVAAELGYGGPDAAGRSLRRGRAGAVGVLMSEGLGYAFSDPGLVAFMNGLASELGAAGLGMLLVPPEADREGTLVRSAIVDAFIICAVDETDPAVAAVISRRLPVVSAGSPRVADVPFIGIDNRAGGRLAAEHLIALGHRRLVIVTRSSKEATSRVGLRQRVDGFVSAVRDSGNGDGVVVVIADDNTEEAAERALRSPLSTRASSRPTAIFGVTDVLAIGAMAAARTEGLRIPADVSIVGFDDIVAARRTVPALTTVAQSLFEQGVHAARMTLALLAGNSAKAPLITADLVVRGSTAPPPSRQRRGAKDA